MISIPPALFIFISAELLFLVVRSEDIRILSKTESQRTQSERSRVQRGLGRSIILEMIVFVPASAGLVLLASPLLFANKLLLANKVDVSLLPAYYAILGIASYGFPFATIRTFVTRIALQTLREFAQLQPEEVNRSKDD
jgi:hypothetical protein